MPGMQTRLHLMADEPSVYRGQNQLSAFGWETIVIHDGHDFPEILRAYRKNLYVSGRPAVIIAEMVKGKEQKRFRLMEEVFSGPFNDVTKVREK